MGFSIVVVTGGGSGIGKALCCEFAARGSRHVVVVDREQPWAEAVAATLPAGVGHAMAADVSSEMDMRRIIVATESLYGPIDAFCCNAGIPANGGAEVPNDEWLRIWNVNVMQTVFVSRHLLPRYESRGGGALLVTASAAGLLTQVGSLPYSVTKHAAVGLAEWLAISYAAKGVSVSCLCPQAVSTAMAPMGSNAGPAGVDGVLSAERVATKTVDAMAKGTFLILPHADVAKYMLRRATDHERWLKGMVRMHETFGEAVRTSPNMAASRL